MNYQIACNTPFNKSLLTYQSNEKLSVGQSVLAPLGKRDVLGWVVKEEEQQDSNLKLKTIKNTYDQVMNLSDHEMKLYTWMSDYYHYPLGQLVNDALPKAMKRPRPLEASVNPEVDSLEPLTDEQQVIFDKIIQSFNLQFSKHLVHGVTGSGKTHIYLHLMKKILKEGKSVLFLLPEINLTPQFLDKFRSVLNQKIYAYSSEVGASQKYQLRDALKKNKDPVVIVGVRSSVFLPIENIGLIIVDEEHDSSFKQDDRCAYNARDVAIKRASMLKIPVVLGSATPSLETYSSLINTNYYYPLRSRVHGFNLPTIEILDQRDNKDGETNEFWPLTRASMKAIEEAHKRGEQALVFINRLGFSSYLQCSSCGHQFQCPNCSTNMRYFKARNEISCQTCQTKTSMPSICPECSCVTLIQKGYGTEKVEQVLRDSVAGLRVERFDRDEIKNLEQLKESLDRFHGHEVDVLVGTQMLSKGHNFKKVNTVVVLGIDQQLNFPDFRAMERAWQTLVQVSGRSGRFGQPGKVLVQTHSPEHPLFIHITRHHFDEFYGEELELRQRATCPPLAKMAVIYLTYKDKNILIKKSLELGQWLEGLRSHHYKDVDILGPRPAIMEKRVNKFTWTILLRSTDLMQLHAVLNICHKNLDQFKPVQLKLDIDPQVIS